MPNARPLPRMTCAIRVNPGGSHAPVPFYPDPRRCPRPHTQLLCQKHLRLAGHGPKCTAGLLWAVLLYAASRITSLASACASLKRAPSDSAVHDALLATLPPLAELQRRVNRALQGDLPRCLRRRRQPLAIDLHLVPYHGQPLHDEDEIYRSEARDGTTHFHA